MSARTLALGHSELIAQHEELNVSGGPGFPADGAINRVLLLAWSGREDELRAAVAGITDLADSCGHGHMVHLGLHARTVLHLGLGRYQSVLDHALTVYRDDPPGVGNLVLPLIVEAGVRADHREAAGAALARITERARVAGTPWGLDPPFLLLDRAATAPDSIR